MEDKGLTMIDILKIIFEKISEKSGISSMHRQNLKSLLGLGLIKSRKAITNKKRERIIKFLSA